MLKSRPRNIAILTYRLVKGYGVDVVVNAQASALSSRGYIVKIYTIDYDPQFYHQTPYEVIVLGKNRSDWIKMLSEAKHDLVISHTSPFFEILPEIRTISATIAFEHGDPNPSLFPPEEYEIRSEIARYKTSSVYPNCDGVIAISRFIARDIKWPAAHIIYNGVDHLDVRSEIEVSKDPAAFKKSIDLPGKKMILTVCRLGMGESHYKGIDLLIELRKLIDSTKWQVVVAGRGDDADKKRLESEGIRVLLNLENPQLVSVFKACDLYVALSKWEGFNLPLVEAQKLGCPAIALDTACHSEVCHSVFQSVNEIASFIETLTDEDLASLSSKSKETADQFTWERNVDQLEKYLKTIWKSKVLNRKASYFGYSARMLPKFKIFLKNIGKKIENLSPRTGFFLRQIRAARIAFKNYQLPQPNSIIIEEDRSQIQINRPVFEGLHEFTHGLISVCILTKDHPELIKPCINSLMRARQGYPVEIIIGDTGSSEPEIFEFYREIGEKVHIEYFSFYNFSACNNRLAKLARGEFIIFLNNDTLVGEDFFKKIILPFTYERVCIVGPKMLFRDESIQHAGCEIFTREPYRYVGWHPYSKFPADFPEANIPKEMPAVTGACLAIRNKEFHEVGGFDEMYEEECQDIDLCLKIKQSNFQVIYLPTVCIFHFENSTRIVKQSTRDRDLFKSRWRSFIDSQIFSQKQQSSRWIPQICVKEGCANLDWKKFINHPEMPLPEITIKGQVISSLLPKDLVVRRAIPLDYEDPMVYDLVLN